MKVAIGIRNAKPADYGYIVHSGVREMANAKKGLFKEAHLHGVNAALGQAIDACLRGGKAVVAYDTDNPDALMGWALFGNRDALLYVYVAWSFRGNGIARLLKERTNVQAD